jgi:hypothetical protein
VQGQTVLESRTAPEITPLWDIDCPIDDLADGEYGRNIRDVIYSFDSCYQNFLNQGLDESICGKFSEEEKTWLTNLDYNTNACFYGFSIAKENYKICNEIKSEANYHNVYIHLSSCYSHTAFISRDLTPCKLLKGEEKTDCFHFFGPSINLTWIFWFLLKVIFYILISLILFIASQFFINSEYKKKLITFSIVLAAILPLSLLVFQSYTRFNTDTLNFIILIPFISLFLSALIIQGYNLLIKKLNKKWIHLMYSLIAGFIHGFLVIFISSIIVYSKYGIDLGIVGVFVYSLIFGGVLAIIYLIFCLLSIYRPSTT